MKNVLLQTFFMHLAFCNHFFKRHLRGKYFFCDLYKPLLTQKGGSFSLPSIIALDKGERKPKFWPVILQSWLLCVRLYSGKPTFL